MLYHKLFLLIAPTEPINFHLVHLGQTSITVSWNSPIFPNGPITYYIVSIVLYKYNFPTKDLQRRLGRVVFSNPIVIYLMAIIHSIMIVYVLKVCLHYSTAVCEWPAIDHTSDRVPVTLLT